MRINAKVGVQHATFDGAAAGEGLAIFFSQGADATIRYRFLVKAITSQGVMQVGTFYSSPPNATLPPGQLTRMIAAAVCPGATSWAVDVSAAGLTPVDETAEMILASSRCSTAPVGVVRVNERYRYNAGSIGAAIPVPPGRTVTRVSATGLAGGGTMQFGAGDIVTVPANMTIVAEPKADLNLEEGFDAHFTNVSWFLEYLESA